MTTPMLSLYSFKHDQVIPEDLLRSMKLTLEKTITFKTPYCVLMCQRVVLGDWGCHYVVCESCHVKRKPKGHQKSASYEERKMTCHHEFHYFVDQYGLWWCKKKDINGLNLMERAQGCVLCRGNVCGWRGMMILCVMIKYVSMSKSFIVCFKIV